MNLIIKLSSVTYALKARDTLKLKGVRSTVEKNPRPKMKDGLKLKMRRNFKPKKSYYYKKMSK